MLSSQLQYNRRKAACNMTIDLWPDLWAIVAATYVPQQRVQKGPIQGTRKPKSIDTHMVKLIYAHFIC